MPRRRISAPILALAPATACSGSSSDARDVGDLATSGVATAAATNVPTIATPEDVICFTR